MNYTDTELIFHPKEDVSLQLAGEEGSRALLFEQEVLGIQVRLGNQPLVYSLKDIAGKVGTPLPFFAHELRDYYLVVHTISALRTQGTAKVEELRYFAESLGPMGFQTEDLIPKTRFNEVLNAKVQLNAMLGISGDIHLQVPTVAMGQLLPSFLEMAPGLQLQLCSAANFVGKFNFSVQIPIVQSSGIASNSCAWILRPDEHRNALLGDQVLVQSMSVPKGTKRVKYRISGTVVADKGLFWKKREQHTPPFHVSVVLNP